MFHGDSTIPRSKNRAIVAASHLGCPAPCGRSVGEDSVLHHGIFGGIDLPSGKRLHSYGKSPFFMGKTTISMAIFNSFL